jgi:hypothetical protein
LLRSCNSRSLQGDKKMSTIVGNNSFSEKAKVLMKNFSRAMTVIGWKFFKDDLFAFVFIVGISILYWSIAPFSSDIIGILFNTFFTLMSMKAYDFVQSDKDKLTEIGWYEALGDKTRFFYPLVISGLCAGIVMSAIFTAPGNFGDVTFRRHAVAWIHEGKCEKLTSYSDKAHKVCTQMQLVKTKLNREPFIVVRKVMQPDGSTCDYTLLGQKSGDEVGFSNQSCVLSKDQLVKFTFKAVDESGLFSPKYSYTVTPS